MGGPVRKQQGTSRGTSKEVLLLAPASQKVYPSWVNFKRISEQVQKCSEGPDAGPNWLKISNWLSNLSRAGVASSSENSLLWLDSKYQETSLGAAFQNHCPILFLPGAEECHDQGNEIWPTPERA